MRMSFPFSDSLRSLVMQALAEDIGEGDITSQATIPEDQLCTFTIVAHRKMRVCGTPLIEYLFNDIGNKNVDITLNVKEGDKLEQGDVIATGRAEARYVLSIERVLLNFLQHLSGVATYTAKFVKAVKGTDVQILDTRKTLPGLRELDKYAVRVGGGVNHRMRLDDAVLIKDNHIALNGTLSQAVAKAKQFVAAGVMIEVECDTLKQVAEALTTEADRIMLDNMSFDEIQEAVSLNAGKKILEASGNIDLDSIRLVAETGVDYISIGKLTHSAPAVDIGMDISFE